MRLSGITTNQQHAAICRILIELPHVRSKHAFYRLRSRPVATFARRWSLECCGAAKAFAPPTRLVSAIHLKTSCIEQRLLRRLMVRCPKAAALPPHSKTTFWRLAVFGVLWRSHSFRAANTSRHAIHLKTSCIEQRLLRRLMIRCCPAKAAALRRKLQTPPSARMYWLSGLECCGEATAFAPPTRLVSAIHLKTSCIEQRLLRRLMIRCPKARLCRRTPKPPSGDWLSLECCGEAGAATAFAPPTRLVTAIHLKTSCIEQRLLRRLMIRCPKAAALPPHSKTTFWRR